MFSYEIWEISKNTFFTEHLWTNASAIRSSDHVFEFSFFIFSILSTLHYNFFLMNVISFSKFCVHFLFVFVNWIRFATCLNQMSCNRKNWWRNEKCFWSEPKTFASFSGVPFVEKHEGNKWRYTKNLIKSFKILFSFSRFARALEKNLIITNVIHLNLSFRRFIVFTMVASLYLI